jgi:hypothetical protein
MTVNGFEREVNGDCGDLSGNDAGTEILWAFLLYALADDVKLRVPLRDWETDNRVAENMENMAKDCYGALSRCSLFEVHASGGRLSGGLAEERKMHRKMEALSLLRRHVNYRHKVNCALDLRKYQWARHHLGGLKAITQHYLSW